MDTTWATLDTTAGKPMLRFQRRLAHPPEKVWKAITDPAELVHWFPAKVETDLRVGASMTFTFEDAGNEIPETASGEIVEIDPPKLLVYRWTDDILRWELVPDDAGCVLHFTHILGDEHGGALAAGRNAAGWDQCLHALTARLDGHDIDSSTESMLPRIEAYVERFGLGEGEVHEHAEGFEIRFERDLVWRPVEQVWSLLTGEHTPILGEMPPLQATNGYVPAGAVTDVHPRHVLEYSWLHQDSPVGMVRWEVRGDPKAGTTIVLTQTIPTPLAGVCATALAAWQTHLEILFAAMFGDVRCPWPAERTTTLERRYAERYGERSDLGRSPEGARDRDA